ncbi:MAG: hypothetical protein NUW01_07070 [Gemmatimonadaceae bacterium]|nr:hypothetical protein [Gemmatimonadaceae bacterium]
MLPTDVRRDPQRRWRVRLDSPTGGEWIEGELKIPRKLALAERHTNDWLARQRFVVAKVDRWMRWRAKYGFVPVPGTLSLSEPYDLLRGTPVLTLVPTTFNEGEGEDMVGIRCRYLAHREKPMFVSMEDYMEQRTWADRLGIDTESQKAKDTENAIPDGEDVIEVEGGEDPMEVAEARRQEWGIKRSDYLVGNLWDPLGEEE